MNKKKIFKRIIICLFFLVMLSGAAYSFHLLNYYGNPHGQAAIVVDDLPLSDFDLEFGDNDAYKMGLNYKEEPIFVDTDKAFQQLKIDYKEALRAIQKEGIAFPLTKWTWRNYFIFSDQIENSKYIDEGIKIAQFFDIYENSFGE